MQYKLAKEYLPHDTPMVMICNVHLVDDENCICSVSVDNNGILAPFLNAESALPNIYAVELMAQTVGVWNGYHSAIKENKPLLGMLLGGRALKLMEDQFPLGCELIIHAQLVYADAKLANFECTIKIEEICVATGKLNVYEPDLSEINYLFGSERLGEKV